MNKTFLLITVTGIFSNIANGQSHFGFKGGVNLANQVKKISIPQVPVTTQDTKPFVGYQVGAFYKTKLHEKLWISAETNFSFFWEKPLIAINKAINSERCLIIAAMYRYPE